MFWGGVANLDLDERLGQGAVSVAEAVGNRGHHDDDRGRTDTRLADRGGFQRGTQVGHGPGLSPVAVRQVMHHLRGVTT